MHETPRQHPDRVLEAPETQVGIDGILQHSPLTGRPQGPALQILA